MFPALCNLILMIASTTTPLPLDVLQHLKNMCEKEGQI